MGKRGGKYYQKGRRVSTREGKIKEGIFKESERKGR